ncbi:MAG: AMP-binding protein [Candidatus Marinimicrobia bacterium]|nr:AMP-binding protein [Candidatus Neomarinimicrobiota bacterium]
MINQLLTIVKNNPSAVFLNYKNKSYSYEEIQIQVIHTARVINQYNLKKNILIGIQILDPLEFIINWFACDYLGLISVLINPKLKSTELNTIINSVQLSHLITSRKSVSIKLVNKVNLIFNEDGASIQNCGVSIKPVKKNLIDTITIIFTSGSSGKPKPVELSTQNFLYSFKNWNDEIKFSNNDSIMNILPLHHIAGISAIIRGLLSHCPVYLFEKFNIDNFILEASKQKITVISLVPTIIYTLLQIEEGIKCLQSFRMILTGGGPANSILLENCIKLNIPIFVTYGMTETCSGVSGFWINDYPEKLNSVGKPFNNLTISTAPQKNKYSKICIFGEIIANGYWGELPFNSQFISNDLGEIDKDGFLFLKPLRQDRIVTGGENVNPFEIEEVIIKFPNIVACCVLGVENQKWGEEIIAFIKTNEKFNKLDLVEFCKNQLLEFKIPKKFIICEELPKNELGKINRLKVDQLIKGHEHI